MEEQIDQVLICIRAYCDAGTSYGYEIGELTDAQLLILLGRIQAIETAMRVAWDVKGET